MKNLISLSLIFFVITCVSISCKKESKDLSLNIYSPIGTVTIISGGASRTPGDGDTLSIGDSIRTGGLSSADILMGDIGIIRIYENTLVQIKTLIDPVSGDTKIDMTHGKLYSTLGKLSKGSFQVKTPTSVASIRGTSFRITADQNDSRLDVMDGKVQINPVQNNTVIENIQKVVEANQTVSIDRETVIQAIKNKAVLKVYALKPEDIKKIREEIKTIKPELMKKMREDARKKLEKKILENKDKFNDARERSKIKMEQMKVKSQQIAKDFKENQQVYKQKLQENKVKLNQKLNENKKAFQDKLDKLKERKNTTIKKPDRKKNPAGNLSL